MTVDTNTMISITEANQNFSKVARVVDEHGTLIRRLCLQCHIYSHQSLLVLLSLTLLCFIPTKKARKYIFIMVIFVKKC